LETGEEENAGGTSKGNDTCLMPFFDWWGSCGIKRNGLA